MVIKPIIYCNILTRLSHGIKMLISFLLTSLSELGYHGVMQQILLIILKLLQNTLENFCLPSLMTKNNLEQKINQQILSIYSVKVMLAITSQHSQGKSKLTKI